MPIVSGYFKNLIFVHGVLYSPVAVIITQVLTTARQSIVCGRAVVRNHYHSILKLVQSGPCHKQRIEILQICLFID